NLPITARLCIGVGGSCSILAPIRPGDEVLVTLPDGGNADPAIVAILNNEHAPIPIDADNKPVFKNDRLSVFARGVPIEVRTDGGASVRLEANGEVSMVPGGGQ